MTSLDLPLLLEPEQLNDYLQELDSESAAKLLIVDLSSIQNYMQCHVPGAVHVQYQRLVCGKPPAPGKLPELHDIEDLLSDIGLTPEHHVVVYDDEGGGWAGRFIWTLDIVGHTQYSYLNGGLHAWVGAALPISKEIPEVQHSDFHAQYNSSGRAELDDILEHINAESDAFIVWDARSPQEYSGSKVVAQRGGRIPGAVNYEWTQAMDRDRHLRLRDLETVESELNALGIHKDKTIVTHCQSHHRSGFTYMLGKILGFNDIKGYDGSWSEWGNHPTTPIESDF